MRKPAGGLRPRLYLRPTAMIECAFGARRRPPRSARRGTVTRIGFGATLLALALALACAKPRLDSHMYYDHEVDFSKIKTFAITKGDGGTPENRALAESGLRKGLEAKGMQVASAEKADVLVQVDLGRRSKVRISGRMSTGEYAGLAVSMRERRSGDMAWHAVAYMTYYDNLVAPDEIPKAVALVLEDFPPS